MKKILIIEPTVFIWCNYVETLFYNTLNKKALYYNNKDISKIAEMLISDSNNYTIELNDTLLNSNTDFFNEISFNGIGYIECADTNRKKPIQIHPISAVQRSSEMNDKDFQVLIRDNIVKHLTETSIFFNSRSTINNNLELHKQFLFPILSNKQNEIKGKQIIYFLDSIKFCPIRRINIIGHDLFNYSDYLELTDYLSKQPVSVNYYLSLSDFRDGYAKLIHLNESYNTFTLTLFDDYNKTEFISFIKIVRENNINVHIRFAISHENQIELIERIINDFSIKDYSFIPYFNKINYKFFKENVFLTFEEVLKINQEIIDIHSKEYINPIFYGKLSLLPNNSICTDLHNIDSSVNINNTFSIQEVLFKTLTSKNSWRLTRNKVNPCKYCIAKYICPPISNYEIIFNEFKICNK